MDTAITNSASTRINSINVNPPILLILEFEDEQDDEDELIRQEISLRPVADVVIGAFLGIRPDGQQVVGT
jgi:hypothetical protein